MSKLEKLSIGMIVMLGIIPIVAISVIGYGIVLKIMWGWFVEPLGIMAITTPHAVGLSTIVSIWLNGDNKVKTEDESTAAKWFKILGKPIVILLIGYIAHLFM